MSETWVAEQVEIIKKATKTASQSRETALQFLEEAGIIKKSAATANVESPSKKKK